jgi:hypothetical protein
MLSPAYCVTPTAWHKPHHKPRYGDDRTYRLAADWLQACPTVADWGGARGYFRRFLPATVRYLCVDGTRHADGVDVLADLTTYHLPSAGILLRHVIDMTLDWRTVLANALEAFTVRLVVITWTPECDRTQVAYIEHGWPVTYFNPADLRAAMGRVLVYDQAIQTTQPERLYFCQRRPEPPA